MHVLDSPLYSNSWFSAHNIGRADFARLAFVLLLVPLAIEEDCLAEAISCFKLLPVTGSRVRVIRIWRKTPLIFLVCIEISCKKRQMDRVKNYFVPPSHVPNWTSHKNSFLVIILSRPVLINMTVKWLKKQNNCLLCQNLEASEAALRLLWRLAKFFAIHRKLASFWNWGSHLFCPACWQNKIGSSATWA